MPPRWSYAFARLMAVARRSIPLRCALIAAGIVTLTNSPVTARPHHGHAVATARTTHTRAAVACANSSADRGVLANATWDSPALTPAVVRAIRVAAGESGVDPNLLLAIAWRESRFDPEARNHQSSARGLLQFTTATWLQNVHDYGAEHGFPGYAAEIERDSSGALSVHRRATRAAILRLRDDPNLSAALAAESMAHQRSALEAKLGRSATPVDLYLLHVLGTSGTMRFLTILQEHPSASSLKVASGEVLQNAGLLTSTHSAMSVSRTYAAVRSLLDDQKARSGTLLAGSDAPPRSGPAKLIQVSEAP
jgi:hypothetical protein